MFSELDYLVFIEVLNKQVTYFRFIEEAPDIAIAYFLRGFFYQVSKTLSVDIPNHFIGQFCPIIIT
jgi:hypothetical protein